MLLRYATSYVTKSHDCNTVNSMYSYKLEGRQAAMHYLMCNMPAEPEMCFFIFLKNLRGLGVEQKDLRFLPVNQRQNSTEILEPQ